MTSQQQETDRQHRAAWKEARDRETAERELRAALDALTPAERLKALQRALGVVPLADEDEALLLEVAEHHRMMERRRGERGADAALVSGSELERVHDDANATEAATTHAIARDIAAGRLTLSLPAEATSEPRKCTGTTEDEPMEDEPPAAPPLEPNGEHHPQWVAGYLAGVDDVTSKRALQVEVTAAPPHGAGPDLVEARSRAAAAEAAAERWRAWARKRLGKGEDWITTDDIMRSSLVRMEQMRRTEEVEHVRKQAAAPSAPQDEWTGPGLRSVSVDAPHAAMPGAGAPQGGPAGLPDGWKAEQESHDVYGASSGNGNDFVWTDHNGNLWIWGSKRDGRACAPVDVVRHVLGEDVRRRAPAAASPPQGEPRPEHPMNVFHRAWGLAKQPGYDKEAWMTAHAALVHASPPVAPAPQGEPAGPPAPAYVPRVGDPVEATLRGKVGAVTAGAAPVLVDVRRNGGTIGLWFAASEVRPTGDEPGEE